MKYGIMHFDGDQNHYWFLFCACFCVFIYCLNALSLSLIKILFQIIFTINYFQQVYVWHTETKDPILNYELKNPTLLEVKR